MPRGEMSAERDAIAERVVEFKDYNELPLVSTGCDSYASWDPRFKDLSPMLETNAIVDRIMQILPHRRWEDEHLVITGGEPFLNNFLIDIVNGVKSTPLIEIYTGLGVNYARLDRLLKELSQYTSIKLMISAEGVDNFAEFNRYGTKWDEFQKKVDLIVSSGIRFEFSVTLSNLTLLGFAEFYEKYKQYTIDITFAYQPTMMAPYVLDEQSKLTILEQLKDIPKEIFDKINRSIKQTPTELQRLNLKEFLLEFTSRHEDLSLSIFPTNFLNWIGIAHVVQQSSS
jgi:organic radical activating enzyme